MELRVIELLEYEQRSLVVSIVLDGLDDLRSLVAVVTVQVVHEEVSKRFDPGQDETHNSWILVDVGEALVDAEFKVGEFVQCQRLVQLFGFKQLDNFVRVEILVYQLVNYLVAQIRLSEILHDNRL